jgi:hypothetical protein
MSLIKNTITFLLLALLTISCDNDNESRIMKIRINHHYITAVGITPLLVYEVQEDNAIGSDTWTAFYSGIEGFDYVPGKIYDLTVAVSSVENPLADGSSLNYKLIRIDNEQPVSPETQFDMLLKRNGELYVTNTSGYSILNQLVLDCNTQCTDLDVRLQNQDVVIGTFKRLGVSEVELVSLR